MYYCQYLEIRIGGRVVDWLVEYPEPWELTCQKRVDEGYEEVLDM